MYHSYSPDEIWIEEQVASLSFTQELLHRFSTIPIKMINDISKSLIGNEGIPANEVLVLAKQKGKFLKPCPGTQNYICCNYYFLNLATNCPIGCSYCILQGYLNNPYMTVYTNLNDMFDEMDNFLKLYAKKFFRIGTGELTDSLILDPITNFSKRLIPFFLNYPNAILELKTKTTEIDNLLEYSPEKRVIVSWSLNPVKIISLEEKKAPSLDQRLTAAQQCANAGYLIGFHLDPLIHYPGWEQGYLEVIKAIFEMIPSKQIVWISLGGLRYPAVLNQLIRKNHPDSQLVLGEMFPGKDGKLRYFRPIRETMFKQLVQWIRQENEHIKIYLCMESQEIWGRITGLQPLTVCGLPQQLDQAVSCSRDGSNGGDD